MVIESDSCFFNKEVVYFMEGDDGDAFLQCLFALIGLVDGLAEFALELIFNMGTLHQ